MIAYNNMKIVFMGTPEFSVPVLEGLIENYEVVAVVTQPDKEAGRKKEMQFSPIKNVAMKHNIKVIQPEKIRVNYQEIIDINPDIIITCAYGQIIPKEILDCPKLGCINVHASLLPKYRGGAPIHRAILNGETQTGITIMYMDVGMDDGDIIEQEIVDIPNEMNVGELHDILSVVGKNLLLKTLPSIIAGTNKRIKQDESKVTFAKIIKREDELIDFNDSSKNVYNKIRGLSPYPCSYTIINNKIFKIYESEIGNSKTNGQPGEIINIYKNGIGIKTSDGEIVIKTIKPEGKNKMDVSSYLNGIDKNSLLGIVAGKE